MRRAVVVVPIVLLSLLGACGGSESSSGSDSSSGADTSSSSSDGGDEDAAVEVLDVCGEISTDEIGSIIGATFTSEVGPFDACEFDQEDPRATSVAIDAQTLAEVGGDFAAYKAGTSAALTNPETVDVSGVGDEAFITTGTFGDGESIQLQGAMSIDGQLISVNLTQGDGVAADVMVDQAEQVMKLVASKV